MKFSQYISIGAALALMLSMAACSSEDTQSSASSGSETSAVSTQEDSAEESSEVSSAEESAVESSVEEEISIDEQFADFVEVSSGICLKLQVYDRKGTPVRNGTVTVESSAGSQQADTDFSGYAFLSDLLPDQEYTLTVNNEDGEPVGTATLQIAEGDSYGMLEEGEIAFTVADGNVSMVDLAITATEDDGTVSRFELSRIAAWEVYDVTPVQPELNGTQTAETKPTETTDDVATEVPAETGDTADTTETTDSGETNGTTEPAETETADTTAT